MGRKKLDHRRAAYLALLESKRTGTYLQDTLDKWKTADSPSQQDFRLSQEIAYGTMRQLRSLEYIAQQFATLKLKQKERLLLYSALYQWAFMDKIPFYAIVQESVAIAKELCHPRFASFLNQYLRNLSETPPELPQGNTAEEIAIRTSFPNYFVEHLIEERGIEPAKEILDALNTPPSLSARDRTNNEMISIPKGSLENFVKDPKFYVQNQTPVTLIQFLAEHLSQPPKNILDLCSAPGGKLLLCHDLFPDAKLTANDVSEKKLNKIKENQLKYGLDAALTCFQGQEWSGEGKFDLILIDAPCSNSGVLAKRPEARWRLSQETINEITVLQKNLLEHASTLLQPGGQIWYLTCSILKEENEGITEHLKNLTPKQNMTLFPDRSGQEGGFAQILIPSKPHSKSNV